jgi:hypothetical protein
MGIEMLHLSFMFLGSPECETEVIRIDSISHLISVGPERHIQTISLGHGTVGRFKSLD